MNTTFHYLPRFYRTYPLHKTKQREREFNQAQILGSHIAKKFALGLLGGTLLRIRNTSTQTELAPEERFLNVRAVFA